MGIGMGIQATRWGIPLSDRQLNLERVDGE